MLETLGYQVTVRTSSVAAPAAFLEQPGAVDTIISDLPLLVFGLWQSSKI
jgi:hypothetical protein